MSPELRASQAVRDYLDIGNTLSLGECIARAIKEERAAAYQSVLSLLQDHKECESCVVIDELEDQIKTAMTEP